MLHYACHLYCFFYMFLQCCCSLQCSCTFTFFVFVQFMYIHFIFLYITVSFCHLVCVYSCFHASTVHFLCILPVLSLFSHIHYVFVCLFSSLYIQCISYLSMFCRCLYIFCFFFPNVASPFLCSHYLILYISSMCCFALNLFSLYPLYVFLL